MLFSGCTLMGAQTQYQVQPDSLPQQGVPHGEMFSFEITGKTYYPGAVGTVWVYIPAEYTPDKPACLCFGLDGPGNNINNVLDNLIYKKQVPVTIGVFLSQGQIVDTPSKTPLRFDRCYEWDSTNDNLDHFIYEEVLPAVKQHKATDCREINISMDPNDHMIYGGSSGGVGSFTAAWQHPDYFRRVFTAIGTYVGMRGADMYPTLIRKTEPKPIRLFLQDGALDTWNPLFDNWYTQNRSMEESLSFAGYDVNHSWGLLGHEGSHANSIFPDAMRWLWRDYPKPIESGTPANSMFKSVLAKGETWNQAGGLASAGALAAAPNGDVYVANKATGDIYKLSDSGAPTIFVHTNGPVAAQAFGKDGTLYVSQPTVGKILSVSPTGTVATIATGVHIAGLYASSDGAIYASEPGAHDDDPSKIWSITAAGAKTLLDSGVIHSTGLLLTPDHHLLFVAEGHTHWIYSYVLAADGTLQDKQRFYWLHVAESASDAGDWADSTDLAEDTNGDLYVATRMGVQICDRNGRVEGIMTLPDGTVSSLCFGGAKFDTLYIVCADKIYKRKLQIPGVPGFADPIKLPGFGAG